MACSLIQWSLCIDMNLLFRGHISPPEKIGWVSNSMIDLIQAARNWQRKSTARAGLQPPYGLGVCNRLLVVNRKIWRSTIE
jgi:hypothetical protein